MCQCGVGQQSEIWGNLHFVCWRIQSVDGTVALCWGGGGQTVHQTEISSIKSTSANKSKSSSISHLHKMSYFIKEP